MPGVSGEEKESAPPRFGALAFKIRDWPETPTVCSTPGVLRAYRRLLGTFMAEVADFCRRRGVTYLQVRSDTKVADVVLRTFRSLGVVV